MGKRVLITYGVDVDAVAGWLGSYGGEDSTNDISRGKLRLVLGLHSDYTNQACNAQESGPPQWEPSVC